MGLDSVAGWLEGRLATLMEEYAVPGAAVAIRQGKEMVDVAAGVLNTGTGVEATTDSVFQIGSITKVWTTTLVMQLVDEGLVELDAPVRRYLPAFRVADEDASARVTVRHLLCHSAGFDGDVFDPTTSGEDAVERYVEDVLPGVSQLFAPGSAYSYNNAGFCVAGRIVEVLRDAPYNQVLRERLAEPLGLSTVSTRADEAIRHRAALGHRQEDGTVTPVDRWALSYSNAPAGAMLAMSPRDLLGFVGLHLRDGLTGDGERLLSAEAVAAMREPQIAAPALSVRSTARGLGWWTFDCEGAREPVLGHDGGTIGQSAFLKVVPEADLAIALLTNADGAAGVCAHLFDQVVAALSDVRMQPMPTPPEEPLPVAHPERYAGRYALREAVVDVTAEDEALDVVVTRRGALQELSTIPPTRMRVVRRDTDPDVFVATEPIGGAHRGVVFLGDDGDGRAEFLHTGRASPRVT